jgi:hypothetical protein
MKIQDQVANITIEVGYPSPKHVKIYEGESYPVTICFEDWQFLKAKIDKMFKVAESL